jgi:hypothetical protein
MDYKITKDHDEIRTWIEEHGGHPILRDKRTNQRGVIDIAFNQVAEVQESVSWDEFFDSFDTLDLEFRYNLTDTEPKEFSYTFLNKAQASLNAEDEDANSADVNEMPEDDVPVENVIPSAPVRPSPDAINQNNSYSIQ